ncbi:MAG: ABC transporter permease subunit [Deltaproteobacteria bacterium]|nr:ABC transporter permease subunit [Deltaproteobacteria bacterium]
MIILAIAGRELRSIFHTTVGWLVIAGFLLMTGFFWATMVSFYIVQGADLLSNPNAAMQMSLTDHLLAPFFGNTAVVLLMLSPALSMRLFSEEIKQRTLELLLTAPVSTWEIILGKFLGAMGFVGAMLLGTLTVPLSLWLWASPDPGALFGGYLSLGLLAAAVISLGMLFSSLSQNQIVAVVLTFSASLALWILSWVSEDPQALVVQMSLSSHLQDLATGVVRLSDLAYFAGFVGFFLFATQQRVDSTRWR